MGMAKEVAAVLYVAAFVCFALAATDVGNRFADRVKLMAVGLAIWLVVSGGWAALKTAVE